jgi:hypothetical protein
MTLAEDEGEVGMLFVVRVTTDHPSPAGRRCRGAADEGQGGFATPLTRPSATLSRRERD